ncbi:MAG: efflux RND transporter permease subunit [Bacillota bacterium]
MKKLIGFSLKNRAAIIIMVFLVSVMGVYSTTKLPVEFLPSVDNPVITVTTLAQGMDAETTGDTITEPIENGLKQLANVEQMVSSTSEGLSRIDIYFNNEADLKESNQEVERIVNQLPLPQEAMKPFVVLLNTSMIPIAQIGVQTDEGMTLEDENVIKEKVLPQMEEVEGVSTVSLYGQSSTELLIEVDPASLEEKQLTAMQVMMALQGKTISVPSGQLNVDGSSTAVRVVGEINDVSDIEAIMLAPNVKLGDVAAVSINQYYEALTRINGDDGLAFIVTKETSANAVNVGKALDEKMVELAEEYPDYTINMLFSTAAEVEGAVYGMAREVGIGAIAATFVILLFLRNIRTTFIAIVSIPLSIFITMFLLKQSGVSLNILTLGGLAVAVGRLVDDSIVVMENIYRRLQLEKLSKELVIDSTREVGMAITASTLTTIAVFLPVGFVSGSLGEFVLPMILAVVYSIMASLLVALTVVPMLSFMLLKKVKQQEEKPALRYKKVLQWSLSHKFIVLAASFVIFLSSIGGYFLIPQSNVESEVESAVSVNLTFPKDMDPELARENALLFEKELLKEEKADQVLLRMGMAREDAEFGQVTQSNVAAFFVMFEKGKDVDAFIEKTKEKALTFDAVEVEAMKNSFGGFGGSGIQIDVTAANEEERVAAAELVLQELKEIDGLDKIASNYEEMQSEWKVEVKQSEAEQARLSAQQIGEQVKMALAKTPMGEVTVAGARLPASIKYNHEGLDTKEELLALKLASPVAGPVELRDVATVMEQNIKTQIFHKDGKETIQVSAEIVGEDVRKIGLEVDTIIKDLDLPDGANVAVAGVTESMQETFMDLFKMMGIAILLVYLIMLITFGEARAPFAILFSLPLAVVGGVIGLIVTGTSLDMNALIGALMLIGIVTTNAIVLLERVIQNKQREFATREALLEAGATRLRPIVMTAVTTIAAMMPLVFSHASASSLVSKSLAVVVIGGLTVSTALTLIVVPVVYEMLDGFGRKSKKKRRWFGRKNKDKSPIEVSGN